MAVEVRTGSPGEGRDSSILAVVDRIESSERVWKTYDQICLLPPSPCSSTSLETARIGFRPGGLDYLCVASLDPRASRGRGM